MAIAAASAMAREVVDGAKNLGEKGPDACVAARVEEGRGSGRARVGLSSSRQKKTLTSAARQIWRSSQFEVKSAPAAVRRRRSADAVRCEIPRKLRALRAATPPAFAEGIEFAPARRSLVRATCTATARS